MAEDLGSWRHAKRFFLILPSKDSPCRGEGSLQLIAVRIPNPTKYYTSETFAVFANV